MVDVSEDVVTLSEYLDLLMVPKCRIKLDDGLTYIIQIFGWLLPEDHELYKTFKRSVKNITITNLTYKLNNVNTREFSGKLTYHVIPKTRNNQTEDEALLVNPF